MASSMSSLMIALLALLTLASATNFSGPATVVNFGNLTASTNFTAPENSTHSHAKCNPYTGCCPTKNNPYCLDFYPVIHYGPVPAPTTCFNQGPGQLHAWMNILAVAFCDQVGTRKFDSYSKNTFTGYWNPAGNQKAAKSLSHAGGWFSQYPNAALLQIGMTPGRTDALTLSNAECLQAFKTIIDGCNTQGLDGKQGGQAMYGNDAFWGSDELYYTFDPDYQGHPANSYYSSIDVTVDLTKRATYMALHGCGSSC